jgi:hypothetical protein
MNRRTFLKLLVFLPFAQWLHLPLPIQSEPYDSSGGQWVFDGVNGLTFPAGTTQKKTTAATITNFRAVTFLERLFGGRQ